MAAQTLNDFITQTRAFHASLAKRLRDSENKPKDERAALLLDYLQCHEDKLSHAVQVMQEAGEHKQLETWFYEYTEKSNAVRVGPKEPSFEGMTSDEILTDVMQQHKEIIDLYRYLYSRAGFTPARELLQQLIELEEHEAMLLSQEGNRAQEM